jgi:hypothetical protein
MSEWQELILEGHAKAVRSFFVGFIAGRRGDDGAVFGGDVDLATESLGERIKALFAAGSHHAVFAPEPFATEFQDAVERHGRDIGVHVFHRRAVRTASFDVRVETFSRESTENIRKLLHQSAANGIRIDQFVENEEKHPEAHGTELYAPMHEYRYTASGRVNGPIAAVIELWRRARQHDFVTLDAVHVHGDTK